MEYDFGDKVMIEQKRYGAENEMYQYKVIQPLETNYYRSVPVDARKPEIVRGEICPAIRVICCGVSENKVEVFRVQDVKPCSAPVEPTKMNEVFSAIRKVNDIKRLRDGVLAAAEMPCSCGSKEIMIYGGCRCTRGKLMAAKMAVLDTYIQNL